MSIPVNYTFKPVRARAGMPYGQYNQIATYSTTDAGVISGAVVSFNNGAVSNGGDAPAGIVVDSQSLLGLGFTDQYDESCCAVIEQGKGWALTKSGKTFNINDQVAYDPATGELDPSGTIATGWAVVGGTSEDPDGTTRTLIQILPLRQSSVPEAPPASVEPPEAQNFSATKSAENGTTSTKSKSDQASKNA